MVAKENVEQALLARKSYIAANMETLTAKKVRRLLEKDLNVDAGVMDSPEMKRVVGERLDEMLAEVTQPEPAVKSKKPKHAAAARSEMKEPKGDKSKSHSDAKATPAKVHSAAVQKMQRICKQAGIGVGPNIYRKDDVAAAFQELLAKHNLTKNSDASEIAEARRLLEEKRDMEGIDTSNIVEGGRRNRRAAQPSYAAMCKGSGSEDEDEEGGEDDDAAEAATRNGRAPGSSGAKSKAARAQRSGSDSDDFESDGGEERRPSPARAGDGGRVAKRPKVVLDDEEDDDSAVSPSDDGCDASEVDQASDEDE